MARSDENARLARDARPIKDAPPSKTIAVIEPGHTVSNEDLITALNRANRLIEWMSRYIGSMAPMNYHDCYSDLNEHGLFMGWHGKEQRP